MFAHEFVLLLLLVAIPEEVRELENRVLENRQSIRQWHVQAKFERSLSNPRTDPHSDVAVGFVSVFDRGRSRVENTFRSRVTGQEYTDITIFNDRQQLTFSDRVFDDGSLPALGVADRDWVLSNESHGEILVMDIRQIGMFPGGLFLVLPLTTYLGNPNRSAIELADDTVNGVDCKKVSFLTKSGAPTRMWISPTQGYSLIRMEQDWRVGESAPDSYRDQVLVAVRNVPSTEIWFPSQITRTRHWENGGVDTESMDLEVVSMNQDLDPRVFSLEDLKVPAGTFVNKRPYDSDFVWDGAAIQPANPRRAGDVGDESTRAEGPSRTALLLGANVLLILCLLVLWKWKSSATH